MEPTAAVTISPTIAIITPLHLTADIDRSWCVTGLLKVMSSMLRLSETARNRRLDDDETRVAPLRCNK